MTSASSDVFRLLFVAFVPEIFPKHLTNALKQRPCPIPQAEICTDFSWVNSKGLTTLRPSRFGTISTIFLVQDWKPLIVENPSILVPKQAKLLHREAECIRYWFMRSWRSRQRRRGLILAVHLLAWTLKSKKQCLAEGWSGTFGNFATKNSWWSFCSRPSTKTIARLWFQHEFITIPWIHWAPLTPSARPAWHACRSWRFAYRASQLWKAPFGRRAHKVLHVPPGGKQQEDRMLIGCWLELLFQDNFWNLLCSCGLSYFNCRPAPASPDWLARHQTRTSPALRSAIKSGPKITWELQYTRTTYTFLSKFHEPSKKTSRNLFWFRTSNGWVWNPCEHHQIFFPQKLLSFSFVLAISDVVTTAHGANMLNEAD